MEERLAITLFVALATDTGVAIERVARKQADLWITGIRDPELMNPSTLRLMPQCMVLAYVAHKGE